MDEAEIVNQEVQEVRAAMNKMKTGKAVGTDDIPVEAGRCLGELTVDFLTRMPDECRRSVLILISRIKGMCRVAVTTKA